MWRLLLGHLFLASAAPLIFQTGPPELSPNAGAITFPMREPEYRKLAGSGMSILIPVRKLPAGASAHALYGYNFVVGGKNRGWILDGDAEHGWTLYLDMDGTGDLTTAPPLPFEKVDGVYRLVIEATDGDARWPVRFQITHFKDAGEEKLAVGIQASTVRKGVVELGGARISFKLIGDNARYNRPTDRVAFDRKGSGEFESYKISDHYVNLAGKTYAFTVDAAGNALILEESATPLPDRPSLKPGSPAPAFAATDIDQNTHRLEDYRGRMLLLEFWSTRCGPCREEAPGMVKFFEETVREKVAFLGISSDDAENRLREFLKQSGISWPQIREPWEGAMHRSYRVEGEPTYFLLGPNAEIVDAWVGGGLAIDHISKYLAAQ